MAKIRARTRDWLAVSITARRKSTRRQGRKRGEGLRRKRCRDAVKYEREKAVRDGREARDMTEREEREAKEEMAERVDETVGKVSCVKWEGSAAKNLPNAGVKYLVRKLTKWVHFEVIHRKIWRNLDVPAFKNIHLVAGILDSGLNSCCHKAGDRTISLLGNPERSLVGRHLLPFRPKTLRKDKIKEAHLTTPPRQSHPGQCAAVFLVSTLQPSSNFWSSDVLEEEAEWGGEGVGDPRSASC